MTITITSEVLAETISLMVGILAISFTGYLLAKKEYKAISIGFVGAIALHTMVEIIKLIINLCK